MFAYFIVLLLTLVGAPATTESPEIVGQKYVQGLHVQACLELDAANVKSHIVQDKLVCEFADPLLTSIIPLLEQGNPKALLGKGFAKERARIYTLIATQGAGAYRLKHPGGNSHGMFQMTVATYHGKRRGYPEANLPAKFIDCAQDHLCSAKFAILHNDSNTALLAHRMSPQWRDRMRVKTLAHARYLAAAYTSGMIAYRLVMKHRGGPNWPTDLPKAQWRRYVRMLERLYEAGLLESPTT